MSLGSILSISLLLALTMPANVRAQNPCLNNTGIDRNTLYDYRRGVDLSLYNPVGGDYTVDIPKAEMTNSEVSEGFRVIAQRKAWAEAFNKIDMLGLSFTLAKQAYLEGYDLLRRENDISILSQDIKIYRESEEYDWNACKYRYNVELIVPRLPSLGPIDEVVRELLADFEPAQETPDGVDINLSQIVEELLDNPKFKKLVREISEDPSFQRSLPFRDDDTQRLLGELAGTTIEIPNYRIGQYRINAVVGAVIAQAVAPKVLDYLNTHESIEVSCWGYTDTLKVRNISYWGYAEFGSVGIPQAMSLPADLSPRLVSIHHNNELSIARAYEGALALAIALEDQIQNPRLSLRYVGGGEIQSKADNRPESRKIVYKIKFIR